MATGLLAAGAQQGVKTLSLSTADNGSGVSHLEVFTPAGLLVGSTPVRDACHFNYAEACPPTRTLNVPVDTAALPAGPQRLAVRIVNAAGLVRAVDTPEFTVGLASDDPNVPTRRRRRHRPHRSFRPTATALARPRSRRSRVHRVPDGRRA